MRKLAGLLLAGSFVLALAGCGKGDTKATAEETTAVTETSAEGTAEETTKAAQEGAAVLQIGQVQGAAHGTKSFAITTVVVNDDTIVSAFIDEYQYLDAADATGVPNSEEGLAASVAEGKVLGSKRVNNELYSAMMADKGGATASIADNLDAVQEFVKGKTVTELEALLKDKTPEEVLDAVSGATLVDTNGYLTTVIDAAKAAKASTGVDYDGDLSALTLNRIDGSAHGTKGFTVAAALTDGKSIVLSYVDEFQYMALEDGAEGVPNSEGMAENVIEGSVLISKRENNKLYSELMAEKGGATQEIAANFDAVQDFVNGKEIAEIEGMLKDKEPEDILDAVSGATLVDTTGYLSVILEAAK